MDKEREYELLEYSSKMKLLMALEESEVWTRVLEPAIKEKIRTYSGGFDEDGVYYAKMSEDDDTSCLLVAKVLGGLLNLIKKAKYDAEEVENKLKKGKKDGE